MDSNVVTFSQARSLKKLGFDLGCAYVYDYYGKLVTVLIFSYDYKAREGLYGAPTVFQASEWLREEKDLYINPVWTGEGSWRYRIISKKKGLLFDSQEECEELEKVLIKGIDSCISFLETDKFI